MTTIVKIGNFDIKNKLTNYEPFKNFRLSERHQASMKWLSVRKVKIKF